MTDKALHIFFKEHPTRPSTTPWSKVREAALLDDVRAYLINAIKARRNAPAARTFGGYRLEFQRTPLQRADGVEEVIWTVYHSDAEVAVTGKRSRPKKMSR